MKIITVSGYYNTGSSAAADLIKEYKDVSLAGKGYYEIRFVQDPDGISDLYYNIVENNHRHNTSNAIKRFIKYLKYLNGSFYTKRYRKIFGKDFYTISMDYVKSICELKSKSWWHVDEYNKGELFNFIDLCYGKIMRSFSKAEERQSLLKNREYGYYSSITDEEFCDKTKLYLNTLFEIANVDKTAYVLSEQLVPPSNINRYLKFFDELKVIVVDRDPRDLYIACKVIDDAGIIPLTSVEDFCKWYIITRRHRKREDLSSALYINFEDLVLHYDETVERIEHYLGFNHINHVEPKKYFDPKVSMRGINLIDKYPQFKEDVRYIENELKEYLYEH